jgi:hypothetical protein
VRAFLFPIEQWEAAAKTPNCRIDHNKVIIGLNVGESKLSGESVVSSLNTRVRVSHQNKPLFVATADTLLELRQYKN